MSSSHNFSCFKCAFGYYTVNDTCIASICSDGNVTSGELCDDGNLINGDGCNSFCLV